MFCLDERLQADTEYLGHFPLCQVLLMKDSRYPWVILVPAKKGMSEYYHLSAKDRAQLMEESSRVAEKMADHFSADSMNVAELGNIVSQLHVHHVARNEGDPAWPGPVWGHSPMVPYDEAALAERKKELLELFDSYFIDESEIPGEDASNVYW